MHKQLDAGKGMNQLCDQIKHFLKTKIKAMKKLVVCLLAITAALSSFSQTLTNEEYGVRKIKSSEGIKSLVVNNEVSVVLLNSVSNQISIEGDRNVIELYSIELKKNTLTITNNSKEDRTGAIVYVPAGLINQVTINGNSAVTSKETLRNKHISVWMNGESNFWVRTYGKVYVEAAEGFDYTYASKSLKH